MSNDVNKQKKVRVSYLLPNAVLDDVKESMLNQGYDLKGKSKWISEAVNSLLSINNYCDLVKINDQMDGLGKLDFISIDTDLKSKLANAVIEIRKLYPSIEGVQSKILRTAILQRLLR